MSVKSEIEKIRTSLSTGVELVAVSKMHPASAVVEAYEAGQRVFGESRPQEMTAKYEELPKDIRWHLIGHLQTNKVRMIAPYVAMIQSVDSEKLLRIIDEEAIRCGRKIDVLLEVKIAQEESKYGWNETLLRDFLSSGTYKELGGVCFRGVMGIATLTEDMQLTRSEFTHLKRVFDVLKSEFFDENFDTLSMGMSADYELAVECGSNMVRVGSTIFGSRYTF